ncbi:Choline transport protein [Vanrija pseudolonga]|uniref:Choline transport protein n=1 Tax=Vanrija pseudolonga TaxID=143232 RepID=A0AAF0YFS3_9TREE|nr:Choline transport protein [Vanrija pseudolonga]
MSESSGVSPAAPAVAYTTDPKHSDDKSSAHKVAIGEVDHTVHLERRFGFWSCLGMAFIMLNSWTAILGVVLPSGGAVSVVWGCLTSAFGAMMTVLSLAEVCHIYPTTGGQYDWTYMIAPKSLKTPLSYLVAWSACAGWVTLTATASAFCGTFVTTIVALWHPDFEMKNYQTFLIYILFPIAAFCLNTFGVKILPAVERSGFYWGISGIVVVSIVCLATASPNFRPAKEVFTEFTNVTGWPDGMAFLIGLLQSTVGLSGYDAITHMMEEMPTPSRYAPRVMIMAVGLGATTSWFFLVILLFCIKDIDAVIAAPAGPLLEIYYQATNSAAGSTCLVMFNFLAMVYATQGIMTIASRMVFTFSRDHGFGRLSPLLAPVHPKLMVPVWCLVFVCVADCILGFIYLGSSIAFNAIAASSMFFLQLSYIIPIAIVLVRGEEIFANQPRRWSLGGFRRIINACSLIFLTTTSVIFLFPPALPVDGATMNYVCVVIGVVGIMSAVVWLMDGRKHFVGPTELAERLEVGRRSSEDVGVPGS